MSTSREQPKYTPDEVLAQIRQAKRILWYSLAGIVIAGLIIILVLLY